MNSKGELRLADGTPVRVIGDLPLDMEWTPVTSHGPSAKWDWIETDVYTCSGILKQDDLTALIDLVEAHYNSSEIYYYVDKYRYWQLKYLAQGKRYPSPRRRRSKVRMSKKWRDRA